MIDSHIISNWLDSKISIDETIGVKRYGMMIKLFRKELESFDFYENDKGDVYIINCDRVQWVFVERFNSQYFYFNKKYFTNFLFKLFEIDVSNEYIRCLIRKLVFDVKDILIKNYYHKYEDPRLDSIVLFNNFSDKLGVLQDSLRLMINEINFKKSDEYGGFIES